MGMFRSFIGSSNRNFWMTIALVCVALFVVRISRQSQFVFGFQWDSDRLIWSKLAYSDLKGQNAKQTGLMVATSSNYPANLKQVSMAIDGAGSDKTIEFKPYFSQFGVFGEIAIIFWPFWKLCSGGLLGFAALGYAVNFSLIALVFFAIGKWINDEMGRTAAAALLVGFFGSKWMLGISTSVYWGVWTWFLPMLASMYFVTWSDHRRSIYVYGCLMFVLLLFRFLAGYEFASSIGVAAISPIIYIGYKRRWQWRKILKNAAVSSAAICLAFTASVSLHVYSMYRFFGSMDEAMKHFLYTVLKRGGTAEMAKNAVGNLVLPDEIESLKQPLYSVVLQYLGKPDVWAGLPVILIVFAFGFVLYRLIKKSILTKAEVLANENVAVFCFSILGPMSWYVLMKGHSYIHQHINFVLWYVPFLIWVFSIFGKLIEDACRKYESAKSAGGTPLSN